MRYTCTSKMSGKCLENAWKFLILSILMKKYVICCAEIFSAYTEKYAYKAPFGVHSIAIYFHRHLKIALAK